MHQLLLRTTKVHGINREVAIACLHARVWEAVKGHSSAKMGKLGNPTLTHKSKSPAENAGCLEGYPIFQIDHEGSSQQHDLQPKAPQQHWLE